MKLLLKTIQTLMFLTLCYPLVYAQTANDVSSFILFVNEKKLPVDAKYIDKIKVIDKGFKTHCTLPEVIEEAKEKAGKIGGNVLNITSLYEPDGWSTCYRIKADVYHMENVAGYWKRHHQLLDSFLDNIIPDTAEYALALIYVNTLLDAKPVSDLKVNDSVVYRFKKLLAVQSAAEAGKKCPNCYQCAFKNRLY